MDRATARQRRRVGGDGLTAVLRLRLSVLRCRLPYCPPPPAAVIAMGRLNSISNSVPAGSTAERLFPSQCATVAVAAIVPPINMPLPPPMRPPTNMPPLKGPPPAPENVEIVFSNFTLSTVPAGSQGLVSDTPMVVANNAQSSATDLFILPPEFLSLDSELDCKALSGSEQCRKRCLNQRR